MDEALLHSASWNAAVVAIRERVGLPTGPEAALDEWLTTHRDPLQDAVVDAFTEVGTTEGLSLRYLNYFLACVLSHHDGGPQHHSGPHNIWFTTTPASRAALRGDLTAADGYYRITYAPWRAPAPGMCWKPRTAPRAFSVAWPNTPFAALYDGALAEARARVASQLHEPLGWFVVQGWAYGPADDFDAWQDGRRLLIPPDSPLAGKSYAELLGLRPDLLAADTVVPIPFLSLPGSGRGAPDQVALYFRGGAGFDEWRRPRVERDPSIDKVDRALADRCEAMLRCVVGHPSVTRVHGGRPRLSAPAPGGSFAHRLQELLEQKLSHETTALSRDEVRRMTKSVEQQARNEWKARGLALPDDHLGKWWDAIVADWRTHRRPRPPR